MDFFPNMWKEETNSKRNFEKPEHLDRTGTILVLSCWELVASTPKIRSDKMSFEVFTNVHLLETAAKQVFGFARLPVWVATMTINSTCPTCGSKIKQEKSNNGRSQMGVGFVVLAFGQAREQNNGTISKTVWLRQNKIDIDTWPEHVLVSRRHKQAKHTLRNASKTWFPN